MLRYRTVPVTAFAQNCSLVWCDETMRAAFIDPGGDVDRLYRTALAAGVTIDKVMLTHAHIDHAGSADEVAKHYGVPIVGPHRGDKYWIDGIERQALMFGLPGARSFVPERWLDDGDEVMVGRLRFAVRHCPGHTPGHVVFHQAEAKRAFVGDVLFSGSIGRTDFPGGDFDTLIASITGRLWPMGDDTVFVPGHGPESTFGEERRSNPFVNDAATGIG
jgi:glyoxylase-like metal-dependent hydrolase (beta-lactamase superfamily II)